ncbi:MAG: DUF3108 domain-containing protein [Pseudomonadota bacterium]
MMRRRSCSKSGHALPGRTLAAAVVAATTTTFALAGGAAAADADPVRLAYDAYIGPFYVVSAEAELRLDGDHYRVVTRARSEGVASLLFSWESEARSEGTRRGGRLVPSLHEVNGEWGGTLRQVMLSYEGQGPIKSQVTPPPDGTERDPVPAPLTVGTVDPLSATLSVLLGIAAGGRCEGEYPIYDGRRRYDMIVSPGAETTLPAVHSSVFAGPAQRCHFQLRRIAGFWKKQNNRVRSRVTDPALWVASPLEGVAPVPVRFTAETGFGELRIHLTRVERGSSVLALPES